MPFGVLIALISYGVFSCGDAIIKGLGHSLPIFEITFFTCLFSALPMVISKPRTEPWRGVWRVKHPWLLQLRGFSGLCSTLLVTYAFVTVPLAEVYSLVFLAPIFVTIISILVLKERVSGQRLLLLAATFCGVLLVVRPGFRDVNWGHLAAVVAAMFSSITTIVLRHISGHEGRTSIIGVLICYTVVINGILMVPFYVAPSPEEWLALFACGLIGGTGQVLFVIATRHAEASQVAPAQYSQIIWAIVFGAIFYREMPDHLALVGLMTVLGAGVLNVLTDEARLTLLRRFIAAGRRRPASLPDLVPDRPMTPAPMPEAVVMQRK
jgi:drug/metabolite transporter (DMT)-like permease